MRTTLDIEDDVLLTAREISRQRGVSMGKVVSDLARQALTHQTKGTARHGLPLFPVQRDAGLVSLELMNQLCDEVQ
jgi:hypothetical protein